MKGLTVERIVKAFKEADIKRLVLLNLPYLITFYIGDRTCWLYRHIEARQTAYRIIGVFSNFSYVFRSLGLSFYVVDLLASISFAGLLKLIVVYRSKNAKKFRQGVEYGSARWGSQSDIKPFVDEKPDNNIILTATESLTMSSRPKNPKYARNKNICIIGGSGSGKTRFFVKPQLMQLHSSYCVTDPKGQVLVECGKMLQHAGYEIKVLNTINFNKSQHYNPFCYIRCEKDILKLVNTLVANTKGEGEKASEDFWTSATCSQSVRRLCTGTI